MIGAKRWGEAALLYCAVCWGSTFFIVKHALRDLQPLPLIAYRFLFSALLILPFLRGRSLRAGLPQGALLSVFVVTLFLSQTVGLQWTTATNSGFITGLFVLFVPVFGLVLFSRKPRPSQWVAIILALAGLWLLTGGILGFNRGDGLTLIAAAAYALHLLLTDRYVKTGDPVVLAFHQLWITGLSALLAGAASRASFRISATPDWFVIGFLALFPTVLGFFAQMVGQRHVSPIRAALLLSLEPGFAAIFSWRLGGEAMTLNIEAGGGLILAAILLSELSRLGADAARHLNAAEQR